jgi:hypothetical protein
MRRAHESVIETSGSDRPRAAAVGDPSRGRTRHGVPAQSTPLLAADRYEVDDYERIRVRACVYAMKG